LANGDSARTDRAKLLNGRQQQTVTRYRLLETTRAYAREKLDDAGETQACRCRHAEYFLLVSGIEPSLE